MPNSIGFWVFISVVIAVSFTVIRHLYKKSRSRSAYEKFASAEENINKYDATWYFENGLDTETEDGVITEEINENEALIKKELLKNDRHFQKLLRYYTRTYLTYLEHRPEIFCQQKLFAINRLLRNDDLREKVVKIIIAHSQKREVIRYRKGATKT